MIGVDTTNNPAAANVISGNSDYGVGIEGGGNNVVAGNLVGLGADGSTVVGNRGDGGIEIDGDSSGNTIGGTTAAARNVISGNQNSGIGVGNADGTAGNVIEGNYIGTDSTGLLARSNTVAGVWFYGAGANTLGGTTPGSGNVISGNGTGVYLSDGTTGVQIEGNLIGVNANDTAALGNQGSGVLIISSTSSTNNVIGGTVAGAGNVISGNSGDGVDLMGAGVTVTLIEGNYLGTDATGMAALANAGSGIGIENGSSNNTIGGTTATARNLISGNSGDGVLISGGSTNNTVEGNYLGTDATGLAALANSTGVEVDGSDNLIGGTTAGAQNIISGNSSSGILLTGSNNQIAGNFIGLGSDGMTALGNGLEGIEVEASNNIIGGTTAAARNVISANYFEGIRINGAGGPASGNLVEGNFIGTNAAGTAVVGTSRVGVYIQDAADNIIGGLTTTPGTGAGNVISGNSGVNVNLVLAGTTGNVVEGNLIGTDSTGAYSLGTTTNAGVQIATGAAGNTIGGTTANARNVISGNAGYGVRISGSGTSSNVVEGNNIGCNVSGTVGIANSSDGVLITSGAASNIIGGMTTGSGNLISDNSGDGVDITGSTTTGNVVEGNEIGTNAAGTAALGNAGNGVLISNAASNTIGGTTSSVRNLISGNAGAIQITGAEATGNIVEGNYLGTDVSGTAAIGNIVPNLVGVVSINDGASNNSIGGAATGAGNVISGNDANRFVDGVDISGSETDYNSVQGNFIGVDESGNLALANGGIGIRILSGAQLNVIGVGSDNNAAEGNVISGNGDGGVGITGNGTSGNVIAGNLIGLGADGSTVVGNGDNDGIGIWDGASGNTIGGTTVAARNVISGNSTGGIDIGNDDGTAGNVIEGNYIGTDATGLLARPNGGSDQYSQGAGVWFFGAGANTLGGTTPGAGNVISGNATGVYLSDGTTGVQIEGNYIGVNAAGTAALGNSGSGVLISGPSGTYGNFNTGGSWNNTIGGTAAGAGNLISGNAGDGIDITGSGTTGNVIEGNKIGTDAAGNAAFGGNTAYGFSGGDVALNIPQLNTNPGGTTTVSFWMDWNGTVGGLPVDFDGEGIGFLGSYFGFVSLTPPGSTSGNNLYGIDASNLANHWVFVTAVSFNDDITQDLLWIDGVEQAPSLLIPTYQVPPGQFNVSTTPTVGNSFGGALDGVAFFNQQLTPAEIQAEYAASLNGTISATILSQGPVAYYPLNETSGSVAEDASGNDNNGTISASGVGLGIAGGPIGNQGSGIVISGGASGNTIGGTTSETRNIISGNGINGVEITDSGTSANVVENNFLGLDVNGSTAIANTNDGVLVTNGATGNLIGDASGSTRNVISGNRNNGVEISGSGTSNNQVVGDIIGLDVTGETAVGADGQPLGNYGAGVVIVDGATDNTIGGLTNTPGTAAGNVISGNDAYLLPNSAFGSSLTGYGVAIVGAGTAGNVVDGNIIGLDATGTKGVDANGNFLGNTSGVTIWSGPSGNTGPTDNTIGGTTPGARNIISNSFARNGEGEGVQIAGGSNNLVAGNYIGTDITGTVALGNGNYPAVAIDGNDNTIGGTTAAARNVISGNVHDGVAIGGMGNLVQGNYIGIDATGDAPLGNGSAGVDVGGDDNTIGGTVLGAGNIIGNSFWGMNIGGSSNLIQGNVIGQTANGTPMPNAEAIFIEGSGNTIGGTAAGAGNIIDNSLSGNGSWPAFGVYIAGGSGNVISGDQIQGNAAGGVWLDQAADNTIGGPALGQGNIIAFNAGAGVAVTGATSTGDTIRGNAIYSNTGLGIDLGDTGTILANDSQGHSGPDNYADYPVIQSVTAGPTTIVQGSLQNASAPGTIYYLDFYASTTPNASGHGDAQVYLGSETVTTDSTGLALFNAGNLGPTVPGQYVTVTATDQNGNTSEFALNTVPAVADNPPSVSISGPASLPAPGIPIALGSTLSDSQAGKTYTYAWSVTNTSDPSFTLPTGTVIDEPNLTFTPTEPGTYVAALTVTDSLGGVGTATPLTATVGSGGQTIGINGAPVSAAVNSPLTLNALVTESPGLSVTSYAWSVTKDGSAYTLPSGTVTNASTFIFTPGATGSYVVTLTVTNSAGSSNSSSVSFLAIIPAVTIVGTPANAGVGTPITVGANVNDPNASTPLTYSWSVTANGATVASNAADTTGSFTFTPGQVGAYTISLVVFDSHQNRLASASTSFQVVSQAPAVEITGAPAGVNVGTGLTLGSQVTEPPGLSTTAYAWTITRNGQPYTPAVISGAASPSFSFIPDAGGLYTITLQVTDSAGTVGGTSVSLVVSSGVVAIAGIPTNVGEGTPVTLTATPTDPSLSGSLTYGWSVTSTNPEFTLPAGTVTDLPSFSFIPTEEGNYTVTLTASNAQNQVVSATTATFTAINTTPLVTISNVPSNTTAGKPITLTGSATTPGSTDTFTFAWSVLNGATGQTTTGSGPSFTFTPTGGPELVTLTATDEDGASASTSVVITAAQAAGGIQLSQDGSFSEGASATINVQLLNPPQGVSYSFAWTVTGQNATYSSSGSGTFSASGSSSFTFTPPATGTYLVQVTATGSDNSTATASELVTVVNSPPSVTIGGLPSSGGILEGTAVNLLANVDDPGLPGDLMSYQWTVTGPDNFSLSGSASTLSFIPIESGTYAVSVTVTDSSGAATTATANFQVAHVPPIPLIQNAPGTGLNGSTLTVSLSASVPDPGNDDTFTYAWAAIDQTTNQTIAQSASASFSFSAPLGDALLVTLNVTDDDGGNETVSVPVFVASAGTTITLSPAVVPSTATQVFALALGNAKIDGSTLTLPFDAAALGGGDTLIGGAGPNVLQGDSGDNLLEGGSGPNTLFATAGDTLLGGSGGNPNLFNVLPGNGEVVQSGGPANTLSFAGSTTGITLNLNQLSQNGGQATQFAGYDGQVGDTLTLTGSFQNLVGGSGPDNLFAANNSIVYGGGGNDTLTASGVSNATLAAGSGDVLLSSVNSSNVLLFAGSGTFGGSGSTIVVGGSTILLQGGGGSSVLPGGLDITQFGGGNDTLSANGGSNVTMVAGTGNATLSAVNVSSITQFGGSGNDSLYSSGGSSILMIGGSGNATLTSSAGSSITQFGGSGNDSLYTSGGSSIYMQGGTGNATLSSTAGSSITQFGGTGNDSLYSSGGSSILMQGGTGNATLASSAGSSITQFGGSGNDSLYSSGGSSIFMQGGTGNATLASSAGSSITQFGDSGNDSLYTSDGSSIFMQGGTGNVTLASSGGSSITQFGGSGNDSLYTSGGSSIFMQGGTGNATLASSGGSSITQFGGSGNDSLYSSGGSSILMVGGGGNATLASSAGSSITQFGGSGNDSLYSSGGSSIFMQGGTGNATLASSGGSSITQFGGSGNDSLYTSGGSSILMQGGGGNATLSSTAGSSITQFGGSGNDSLYTSGGSSIFMQSGTGNATLASGGGSSITQFGGSNNDSLYSSGGSSILMVGGSGNATLASSAGSSITQFGGSGNDSLYSSGGNSIFMQGGTGNATLASSAGSSITQFGGSGNDSLYSSGGSSIFMQGGTGNATLSSTAGSSITQFGGSGNDSLYSSGGSGILMVGGTGNVTLSSSSGSSITQFGGSGNDSLYTSGGSSILMQGGTGNATLVSSAGSSITQFGGSGNDSLYASGGSSIFMQGGSGNATLASSGGSSITQFGGSGNDSLYSSGGSSIFMQGGTGNATLASSGGSSITQFGGSGNDSLYTGGGSSIFMQGGTGNVTLSSTGGSSVT